MNNTKTMDLRTAAASVAGRDHRLLGKNNQDALALWQEDGLLCAVVADGCGSSPHSELGARLGARLLANALARRLREGERFTEVRVDAALEEMRQELLAMLMPVARSLAGSEDPRALAEAVRDHLLFTLVAAALGPFGTLLFSLGDGAVAIEEPAGRIDSLPLGPFAGNEPPYLGYALLPERAHGFPEESLRFRIAARREAPCAFALGTDGALELFAGAPPVLLLSDPALFQNPDALRRKLWLLAQGKSAGEAPPLRDDTTLILVRPGERETEA